MNSDLHHTVVLARLADFRRVAEHDRLVHRARPAPAPSRTRRPILALRRIVRPAA
jgi:hypothetical protein